MVEIVLFILAFVVVIYRLSGCQRYIAFFLVHTFNYRHVTVNKNISEVKFCRFSLIRTDKFFYQRNANIVFTSNRFSARRCVFMYYRFKDCCNYLKTLEMLINYLTKKKNIIFVVVVVVVFALIVENESVQQ